MATNLEWQNEDQVKAAIKRWPHIFQEEFFTGLNLVGDLLVAKIVAKTPVGAGDGPGGHLSNSIDHGEPVSTGAGMKVTIGTPVEYGVVVEHGRRPGQTRPPLMAIAAWIWGVRHRFPDVVSEKDAKRLAFPIAKAIGERGFATAQQGPGKGWAMFARTVAEDMGTMRSVITEMRRRIKGRCNAEVG